MSSSASPTGRRKFLARVARVVACASVAPAATLAAGRDDARRAGVKTAGDDPRTRWKMRLSTSSIHYMRLPVEKAAARIAALGFEAIDLWSAHAGCPHVDDVRSRLGAAGLRKLLAELKLRLFAFSVYRGGVRAHRCRAREDVGGAHPVARVPEGLLREVGPRRRVRGRWFPRNVIQRARRVSR